MERKGVVWCVIPVFFVCKIVWLLLLLKIFEVVSRNKNKVIFLLTVSFIQKFRMFLVH